MTSATAQIRSSAGMALRRYSRQDADAQRRWPELSDPLLESYNLRLSDGNLEPYFADLLGRRDYVRFSIHADGELVATISLRDMEVGVRRARLGIVLRGDLIGSGRGGEALEFFLHRFFGPMGFEAMELDVAACNVRAIRCYDRLGFHCAGRHWQAVEVDPRDVRRIGGYDYFPHYVKVDEGQVWILHYDMLMTRDQFRQSRFGH